MGGEKDLDVIVAPSSPFYTTFDCKVSFNYPSRVPNVLVHEARFSLISLQSDADPTVEDFFGNWAGFILFVTLSLNFGQISFH